ncbi:hypothetical protein [Vallicoccus soli]|uniref:Methionine synthase n=1 Tax=Vallicoccus soli TaxID=2339232 RepID=A0A3A3YXL9_9ACTN|nr:hypothetical protein [Vallicoccus soli]RJK96398.1 hypothetical protein D5H78_09200 [Vallicoccus soli]
MPPREAHLVGSLPGPTPAAATTTALDVLGPYLRTLPDGETGERRNWIISIIEGLREHPDLELAQQGDWSDYDRTPRLRVRRGRRLYGAALDLGHVAAVRESHPQFLEVRGSRTDLRFQQGVPGDLDVAAFALGRTGAVRSRRAFTEATLAEVRDVAALTGPGTLFQVEVPLELVMLAKAPPPVRPALARLLARGVTRLAAATAEGTRFAVHLCLGDMNHRAYATMTDVGPLVLLAGAIIGGWPEGRPLELVHAPFAAAERPPTTDPAFYAPLAGLRLPLDVRFAAGVAHEEQAPGDQRAVRDLVEEHLQRRVVVASACGLGRRTQDAGRAVLERTAELCEA